MMEPLIILETATGRAELDPGVGNLPLLRFRWQGREIAALHSAPWRDEPAAQADPALVTVVKRLAGDFFCAPFSTPADPSVPPHGWSANSRWSTTERSGDRVTLRLRKAVSGASLTKTVQLSSDAPLLIQTHVIEGGAGVLPVAHHPMVRLAGAGRLCCSPKRAVVSPATPFEPGGRSYLACPGRSVDPTAFPGATGGPLDLTRLPIGAGHEDFVTMVEAAQHGLGWTAILREEEDDIVLFLKDASVLPVTMLWFSNGGRDYAPWNGRHTGVLGVEDGCSPGLDGETAATRPNPIAAEGVATGLALAPGRRHVVRHAIGAVPRPSGWRNVVSITLESGALRLVGDSGAELRLPFVTDFLKGDA